MVVAQKLSGYGVANVVVPADGHVVREILLDALNSGGFGQVWGVKVGLAEAEADDVQSLFLKGAAFFSHRNGHWECHCLYAVG